MLKFLKASEINWLIHKSKSFITLTLSLQKSSGKCKNTNKCNNKKIWDKNIWLILLKYIFSITIKINWVLQMAVILFVRFAETKMYGCRNGLTGNRVRNQLLLHDKTVLVWRCSTADRTSRANWWCIEKNIFCGYIKCWKTEF